MMTRPREVPNPFWLYYFNVEAIDAAIDRAQSGGAKLLMGPMEVARRSVDRAVHRPSRALFALVAPKR